MLSLVPLPHLQQNDGATKSLSRTFCSPLWIPSGKIDNNYTHLVYNLCRHVGSDQNGSAVITILVGFAVCSECKSRLAASYRLFPLAAVIANGSQPQAFPAEPWAERPRTGKESPISWPVATAVQPNCLLFRGRPKLRWGCFARSHHA